ncbi:MAG: hypothetical protein RLZZ221_2982 [Verrucomicrobiota bacterium]
MKRVNAVMVRLDDAQSAELDRLANGVGVAAATLAHSAVIAMLRCYRENGTLTLPLRMVPPDLPAPVGDPVLNEGDPALPMPVPKPATPLPYPASPARKPRRPKK